MDPFSIPDLAPDSQQEGTCGAVAGDALLIWKPFSVTTQPPHITCMGGGEVIRYNTNILPIQPHVKNGKKVRDQNSII